MMKRYSRHLLVLNFFFFLPIGLTSQESGLRLVAEPNVISLEVGGSTSLTVRVFDASGALVDVPVRYAAPRQAIRVRNDVVQAFSAGNFEIVATAALPAGFLGEIPTLRIPVSISWPGINTINLNPSAPMLFVGTTLTHHPIAFHADGTRRPAPVFTWTTSDPTVASVDAYGAITGHSEGTVTLTASIEGTFRETSHTVRSFPATELLIEGGSDEARTGDVLRFSATGLGPEGRIEDLPVTWAYTFIPDDSIKAPGSAAIMNEGSFVAEVPGRYTILALSGSLTSRKTVLVHGREIVQPIELQGQGAVRSSHTSDLWVFEGLDGKDYAITGTWSAAGWAYFWDVTDPTNMFATDSIQIDARTVNDVKAPPSGRYAALSREGASNRSNGVVILDMANPAHPIIASTFETHGVTGGVHNMFATEDYLFALAGGDKYVIIDIRDLYNPMYVSEYNHPNSRVHDVWVHDGIAYSSEWENGVVVVDVGNGKWGGTIEDPVFVTNIPYPVGATHAAFPYHQESTGKFYLFLGDEMGGGGNEPWAGRGSDNRPYNTDTGEGGVQGRMRGYLHIIDFTDPEDPLDVARYEIPESGTHNLWIEDDVLYQAHYKGGLRVVDISGELMGNLAHQGREIAVYKPQDPGGFLRNQVSVWGAQPHKGHIFFSDMNSGLWAAKLSPRSRPIS